MQIYNQFEKKRKPLGIIVCMGKIAASVLLKLFINENEKNHHPIVQTISVQKLDNDNILTDNE